VQLAGPSEQLIENDVRTRIGTLGLSTQLDGVLGNATPLAASQVIGLLAAPRFADSGALTAAALGSLKAASDAQADAGTGSATPTETPAPTLDSAAVLGVAATLNAPGVGDGLVALEQSSPGGELPPQQLQDLAQGTSALALDLSLRTAPAASTTAATTAVTPKAAIAVQPKSAPIAKSIASAPAAKTPPKPKSKKK
jgi:hypothetical protein